MKTLPLLLTPILAASLFAQDPVRRPGAAAVQPAQPIPAPPPPAVPAAPPAPAGKAAGGGAGGTAGARAAVAPRARFQFNAAEAADNAIEKAVTLMGTDALLPRTTRTGRALVVSSTTPDAPSLANAEEDLSVMALILRRSTGVSRTEDRRIAWGIEVDSAVFGSSSGARNIYLDGYGALFLLGVRFPLLPPPERSEEKDPKQLVNDNWAEAREEYLSGPAGAAPYKVALEQVWTRGTRPPVEEYDADKVEELKVALLQALKNAPHIRILKPTDFITVVVQGGETSIPEKRNPKSAGNRGGSDASHEEAVMTLRVKQPDVEAFAMGTLDLEAFRKRAVLQIYTRRGNSSIGTARFFGAPR